MPQETVAKKYDFQPLAELGIHAICLEKLGTGVTRSLQFFEGFPHQLCSASNGAILGIDAAQQSLSSQVFQAAKGFAPILVFARPLESRDRNGLIELGKSFRELFEKLAEQGFNSGLYRDHKATCYVTCAKWLDLISPHLANLDRSELLSSCRMITRSDFRAWHQELAQASEPWHLLDTLLEERDNPPKPWHSNLSMSAARNVLESSKRSILSQPYGDAVAALVLDFDRSRAASPSHLWEDLLNKLQMHFDQSVGLEGRALVRVATEFETALLASRLLVRLESNHGLLYQLSVQDGKVVLKDLSGKVVQQLTAFPSFEVVPPSSIVDQRIRNEISHKSISLEPLSNVSKKSFPDFIQYFDRVLPHVGKQPLVKQFQRWLDDYPEELRDFERDESKKRKFAREINSRAKMLGYRFKCLKENCGIASGLSVMVSGTSSSGQFVFKHRQEGKSVSHSLSVKLPSLQLVLAK